MRRLWEHWKEIAKYIGDFQARALLTLFYFSVAVPFALLVRKIIKPNVVASASDRTAWAQYHPYEKDLSSGRRQF